MINHIIEKEWRMFQMVNAGMAQAGCQQDPKTFALMCRAQFCAWNEASCNSYDKDLDEAEAADRNLLEEKYIHMMASCAPEDYAILKTRLPELETAHIQLAKRVNGRLMVQVRAMREAYPFLNRIGRPLDSRWDSAIATSVETYQLGELLTYSDRTLKALFQHIDDLELKGKSLAEQIQLACLKSMSFYSFEDAAALVLHNT